MAEILGNIASTSADTASTSWTDIDELSATITVPATGDVVKLQVTMSPNMTSTDAAANFRFTRGGTAISPVLQIGSSDTTNEGSGGTLIWFDSSVSGSQTYAVQWDDVTGTLDTDTGRSRTFQATVIPAADCTLLTNITSTAAHTITGSYANIGALSDTQTVSSTDSVVVMVASVPLTRESSTHSADFRMAIGGTREGWEMTNGAQGANIGIESSHAWAKTGISGSLTFSVQGQNRLGTTTCDTGRTRGFQVLELKRAVLQVSITASGQNNAPGTYADVPSLSGTAASTIATDSVVWMLGHVPIELTGTDETADMRFAQGGTREGPEATLGFGDSSNHWGHASISWDKTAVTGTPTFSLQWQQRAATAVTDASRLRSLQVIELQTLTVEREQDSFRFYDDGTESGSTALAAQNVDITIGKETPFQLRVGMQTVGDAEAESGTLQYKETSDPASEWRDV